MQADGNVLPELERVCSGSELWTRPLAIEIHSSKFALFTLLAEDALVSLSSFLCSGNHHSADCFGAMLWRFGTFSARKARRPLSYRQLFEPAHPKVAIAGVVRSQYTHGGSRVRELLAVNTDFVEHLRAEHSVSLSHASLRRLQRERSQRKPDPQPRT
jgi:hypothetical protein